MLASITESQKLEFFPFIQVGLPKDDVWEPDEREEADTPQFTMVTMPSLHIKNIYESIHIAGSG